MVADFLKVQTKKSIWKSKITYVIMPIGKKKLRVYIDEATNPSTVCPYS
jgi:hypothetical protein